MHQFCQMENYLYKYNDVVSGSVYWTLKTARRSLFQVHGYMLKGELWRSNSKHVIHSISYCGKGAEDEFGFCTLLLRFFGIGPTEGGFVSGQNSDRLATIVLYYLW